MQWVGLVKLANGFCLDKLLYLLIFVVGTSFAFDGRYEKVEDANKKHKAMNNRIDRGDLRTISAVYELTQMVIEGRIAEVYKVDKSKRKMGQIEKLKRDYQKTTKKLSKVEDRISEIE